MAPSTSTLRDWLKWLVFELGAGYYARKLASGPEAELRREFADFLDCRAGTRVLDVGCGPGHLARLLARRGCQVIGADRGWRLLRIAQRLAAEERLAAGFVRAPVDRLPFADGVFDVTVATTVIYFVARPEAALQEMGRVTRPGGTIATLDPHASMSVTAMRAYCQQQGLSARDNRKLVFWARAAELNLRFEEGALRELFAGAGLAEVRLERRLGGMVWFARAVATAA